MRKLLVVLMLSVAMTACSSNWWSNFAKDPVAQVQTVENVAQTTVQTAIFVFNQLKPLLPPADAAALETAFTQAQATLAHAITALNDGLQAAVEAQQPNPDLSKLIGDVIDAVNNIVAIIDQYKAKTPQALTIDQWGSYSDMKQGAAILVRMKPVAVR